METVQLFVYISYFNILGEIKVIPENNIILGLQSIYDTESDWHRKYRHDKNRLHHLWSNQQIPIQPDPHCDVLYQSKIITTAAIYMIQYYIIERTSMLYASDNYLDSLDTDLTSLLWTLTSHNKTHLTFDDILTKRNTIIHEITHKYKDTIWIKYLRRMLRNTIDWIVYRPSFILDLTDHELKFEVMQEIGHGSQGTIYKIMDRIGIYYASKYFDGKSSSTCHREEFILKKLETLSRKINTAYLRFNEDINCQGNGGFIMDFIQGKSMSELMQNGGNHNNLPYSKEMRQQLLIILKHIHSIGIFHGDICLRNVIYNAWTNIFYLIDWGSAHDIDDNILPTFAGSWQNFGPSGYDLLIDMEVLHVNRSKLHGKLNKIEATQGMMNDEYAG